MELPINWETAGAMSHNIGSGAFAVAPMQTHRSQQLMHCLSYRLFPVAVEALQENGYSFQV